MSFNLFDFVDESTEEYEDKMKLHPRLVEERRSATFWNSLCLKHSASFEWRSSSFFDSARPSNRLTVEFDALNDFGIDSPPPLPEDYGEEYSTFRRSTPLSFVDAADGKKSRQAQEIRFSETRHATFTEGNRSFANDGDSVDIGGDTSGGPGVGSENVRVAGDSDVDGRGTYAWMKRQSWIHRKLTEIEGNLNADSGSTGQSGKSGLNRKEASAKWNLKALVQMLPIGGEKAKSDSEAEAESDADAQCEKPAPPTTKPTTGHLDFPIGTFDRFIRHTSIVEQANQLQYALDVLSEKRRQSEARTATRKKAGEEEEARRKTEMGRHSREAWERRHRRMTSSETQESTNFDVTEREGPNASSNRSWFREIKASKKPTHSTRKGSQSSLHADEGDTPGAAPSRSRHQPGKSRGTDKKGSSRRHRPPTSTTEFFSKGTRGRRSPRSKTKGRVASYRDGEEEDSLQLEIDDEEVNAKIPALPLEQIGPLVPDILFRYQLRPQSYKSFHGIVVFCDISGFTALSQTLAGKMNAQGAAETLHKDIGSYLTKICQMIMALGGDILNFAGDAVLAVWDLGAETKPMSKPGEEEEYEAKRMSKLNSIIIAIINLQVLHGNYTTSVDTKLQFKTGVAWGEYIIGYLGNAQCKYFCGFGRAIEEANKAESFCRKKWTVLTAQAWENCSQHFFDHVKLPEGGFVRVKRLSKMRDTESIANDAIEVCTTLRMETTMKRMRIPALADRVDKRLLRSFRAYVPPPVLKKLDNEQSLDYLSEMRSISIAFVHVDSSFALQSHENLLSILQTVFEILFRAFDSFKANIHKIITFDKGIEFLLVLGFPGMKQEQEARHVLNCSHEALTDILQEPLIDQCSIGCASGQTFCGVIGHFERHEYSILGRSVNMACRFMQGYPGDVTCDQEIYMNSGIPRNEFALAPVKELKGLTNVGDVYHYRPSYRRHSGEEDDVGRKEMHLVARDEILGTSDFLLDHLIFSLEDEKKYRKAREARNRHLVNLEMKRDWRKTTHAVLIEGEAGMGATALCNAVRQKAIGLNIGKTMLNCKPTMVESPFSAIRALLRLALKISDRVDVSVLSDKIDTFVKGSNPLTKHRPLVDAIFGVEVPDENLRPYLSRASSRQSRSSIHSRTGNPSPLTKLHQVDKGYLLACLHAIGGRIGRERPHIFIVDDAHYMDEISWRCVVALGRGPTTLSIIAFRTLRKEMPAFQGCLSIQPDEWIQRFVLTRLAREDMIKLANQILGSAALPITLMKIILNVSNGNPDLLRMLIDDMRTCLKIKVVRVPVKPEDVKKSRVTMENFAGVSSEVYIGILMQQFPYLKVKRDEGSTMQKETVQKNLVRLPTPGGVQEEEQIMREMRRKILEVSLGEIYSKESFNEDDIINDNDILFLQSLPDDETRDPNAIYLCIVNKDTDLAQFVIPAAVREMAVSILDILDETQQWVIKAASVLGVAAFQQRLLQEVCPNKDEEALKKSIRKLFELRIFTCARAMISAGNNCPYPVCRCNRKGLFDTACCEYLFFCQPILAEEAYKLLTSNVAIKRHHEAAEYLESLTSQTKRCALHGRQDFLQYDETGYLGPLLHPAVYVKTMHYTCSNSIRTSLLPFLNSSAVLPEDILEKLNANKMPTKIMRHRRSGDDAIADILAKFDPVQDELDKWVETVRQGCECDEARYLQAQVIFHRRASREYEKCIDMMLNAAAACIGLGFYSEAETYLIEIKELRSHRSVEETMSDRDRAFLEMCAHSFTFSGKVEEALEPALRCGATFGLLEDGTYRNMQKIISKKRKEEESDARHFFGLLAVGSENRHVADHQFRWLWLLRIALHSVKRHEDAFWATQWMTSNAFRMGSSHKLAIGRWSFGLPG